MRCWRLEPCSSTFCSTRWSSSLPCVASRACSSGSGQRTTPTTRRSPPAPVGPWEPPGLPSSSTLGCSACKPVACSVHSPTKLISAWRHNFESTDSSHLLRRRGRHLRVREHVHDRLHPQGAQDRDLLGLPSVLHRNAEDRGLWRPGSHRRRDDARQAPLRGRRAPADHQADRCRSWRAEGRDLCQPVLEAPVRAGARPHRRAAAPGHEGAHVVGEHERGEPGSRDRQEGDPQLRRRRRSVRPPHIHRPATPAGRPAVHPNNRFGLVLVEGVIRVGLVLGYLSLIALLPDVRRVFQYHGAEHKTINAFESGWPLEVSSVRRASLLHPRCGTGFLLVVLVVSVIVFSVVALFNPNWFWLITSRVLALPLIAGAGFELIRFMARNRTNPVVKVMLLPVLATQKFTTREPSDDMLEVAIVAFNSAREGEEDTAGAAA